MGTKGLSYTACYNAADIRQTDIAIGIRRAYSSIIGLKVASRADYAGTAVR